MTATVCSASTPPERPSMTTRRSSSPSHFRPAFSALCAAALLALSTPAPASAHETDQYTLPVRTPFADLGDFLDNVHFQAIDRAVR